MAGNEQPIAVALDNATVAFRVAGDRVYTAVEQASLSVADGEFVAIVGPTGCGKSTLLNVAAGLLKPAAGSVRIFGSPLTGLNRDAGYLFQADALFPWKTAIDNVAIGLDIKGAPREQALQRAQGWLTSVGLGAFANRYPHMLSGGQRKRVGLAQVLIRDPKILADGRAVRPARCPDPADHGQSAAGIMERRPQGGAVRHPRSRRGDRACRPRRHHVGRAIRAHHRRLAGAAAAPARHRRGPAWRRSFTNCTGRSGAC